MQSSKHFKKNKTFIKQLRAASLVWLVGLIFILWALSDIHSISQLGQLKYIPVYIITLVSAAGLVWFHYTSWQKNSSI
ncbi:MULTISPECIES: hypothetical protein [unclassified Leeuwenhoekiella]|uniref:hypothetical protein n=1 Tax=unclassified Leeuwenhoekiella TaxID=2615029 RepID=UPI00048EA56A|nr:hypothetical protein [Leeuwenhoekiella sp. MAR_2009_132]